MRKLTQSGKSIIMVSSEISEVMQVSDRIIVMHEGEITGEIAAEEATQDLILQDSFGGANNE